MNILWNKLHTKCEYFLYDNTEHASKGDNLHFFQIIK